MPQNLVKVQRDYVNIVARPMIERLVAIQFELDLFLAEAKNQQTPILDNTEVLNDADDGVSFRIDAPTLTGQRVAQLVAFVTNMRAQVDPAALNMLISLMVRPVSVVVKGQ